MKHDCDMIRDLMPMCIDGTASEKTQQAVTEHVAECPPCDAVYQEMRGAPSLEPPAPQDPAFTAAVKQMQKKRRRRLLWPLLLGVVLSALLFLLATAGYRWYFVDWVMVTPERISFHQTAEEDGLALVHLSGMPAGARMEVTVLPTDRDGDGMFIQEASLSVWAHRAQLRGPQTGAAYYILGIAREGHIYMNEPDMGPVQISQIIYGTHEAGGQVIYLENTDLQHVALFGLTVKSPSSVRWRQPPYTPSTPASTLTPPPTSILTGIDSTPTPLPTATPIPMAAALQTAVSAAAGAPASTAPFTPTETPPPQKSSAAGP